MTITFRASAHPAGRRIDVAWSFERPIPPVANIPALKLVRRRFAYPVGPDDEETVLALGDLYVSPTQTWSRFDRMQFRTTNTPNPDGALEADVTLFHADPPPSEPAQVRLRLFDPATQSVVEDLVTECSRVIPSAGPEPGWSNREALELFRTPGGGPEEPGGLIEIFQGNDNPVIANRLVWTPPAAAAQTLEFDTENRWKADRTEAATLTFETRQLDADPGVPWLTVGVERNADAGSETWSIEVRDRDLAPLVEYYYALFDLAAPPADQLLGRAVALTGQDYDSPRRLFLRLPGAYQRADEPDPTRPTGAPGPLRRFLQPIGHTMDLARSLAEGVRSRHDSAAARIELVPRLARMIGWEPDLAAPGEVQRRDVTAAPEVFASAGTVPNVRALVNRVTSWPCRVKEFVNNVFLTNAPERIRLWELREIRHDGTSWGPPTRLTLTNDVDARPALALDGGGVVWLFWHSDRGGRREIWRQRLDGVDTPVLARAGAPDDAPDYAAVDQDPATVWDGSRLWLFWSSKREGQWDIWARTYTGGPPGSPAMQLTDHPAEDHSPAAVLVPGPPDRLWLFWSSRRRGPTDIWARVLDLTSDVWDEPNRVTTSPLVDDRPAAVVDSVGRLQLFWTRDAAGRQTLWHRTYEGGNWGAETALDVGHARDEGPTVVRWKTGLLVLWHSDHGGAWQLWSRFHDGTTWLPPVKLDPDVSGNKDPGAVIDSAAHLRVVWRSQRRAWRYRSRTLDLNDSEMVEALGTFEDRAHYTYDTATTEDDWYAREAVGIVLTPDVPDDAAIARQAPRVRSFLEPWRPLPVRFVWIMGAPPHTESLTPDLDAGESWSDDIS